MGFGKNFQEQKFPTSLVFKSKFSKEFMALNIPSLFFLKGLENHLKRKFFGNWFDLHFHFYLEFFPRVFFWVFNFQTLCFSHLSYHSILSIRIFVLWEKKLFVVEIDHLVVNPPNLWYPSCVEVDYWSGGWLPLVRGGDCCLAPSSERWR